MLENDKAVRHVEILRLMLEGLRDKHLCIELLPAHRTRAERMLGCGRRACFLAGSDGRMLSVITSIGKPLRLMLCEVSLCAVYSVEGSKLPHRFSDNGHLLVECAGELLDYGPWKVYDADYDFGKCHKKTCDDDYVEEMIL